MDLPATEPFRLSAKRLEAPHPALWFLAGGSVIVAAAAAAVAETYAESGTACGGPWRPIPDTTGFCTPFYDRREVVVWLLVGLGLAVLLVALVGAVRRAGGQGFLWEWPARREYAGRSFLRALALPLAYVPVGLAGFAASGQGGVVLSGLPTAWEHLALLLGVVAVALWSKGLGLSRRYALGAAAVAYLPMVGLLSVTGLALESFPIDTTARLPGFLVWFVVGPPVLWLCLLAAAELERRTRLRGPSEWVSSLVLLGGAVTATVILVSQVLPAFAGAEGGRPYPRGGITAEVWQPVFVTAAGLGLVAVLLGLISGGRKECNRLRPSRLPSS